MLTVAVVPTLNEVDNLEALLRGIRKVDDAVVVIVVLASLLPTLDPLTLILEAIPLYALYELSILLAARFGSPVHQISDEPATEGL